MTKKIKSYDDYMKLFFPKRYVEDKLIFRYLQDHAELRKRILQDAQLLYGDTDKDDDIDV